MGWRVAIGGIWHETNTFASGRTELVHFRDYQYALGEEILDRYPETGTELGGMISAGSALGFELVPTVYAGAVPSATISAAAFGHVREELVARLRAAGPLDGLLLVLHGAAVAEDAEDADAAVLAAARAALGPGVPIVATFDYHANIGPEMVAQATVLIGYDTFPHIDMAARGAEAAHVLARLMNGGPRPAGALRKVPVLTPPQVQATGDAPMKEIFVALHRIEADPGILCGSVAMGFPYADVGQLGASVLVYGEDDAAAAAAADNLAGRIWAARAAFRPILVPVEEGVRQAMAAVDGPSVIVDAADNVGGGAAGDGTVVLDALLRLGAEGAVVVMADAQAVRAAEAAGEGGVFEAPVGGRTDDLHGPPVTVRGRIRMLTDGRYRHTGSYMTGYETVMGRTAVIEAGGVRVVLTSLRTMPFDAEQIRCLGLEPSAQRIIVVKSAIAWRAAYGDVARRAIFVDTPGVGASNLERFDYRRRPRPLWPLDPDAGLETG
jgi:microcystin degradation protein MlrC